jgi:hypothetical protein
MLSTIYPEYSWKPWKFVNVEPAVAKGFFASSQNIIEYIHWLQSKLQIKKHKQWHYKSVVDEISQTQIGKTLLSTFNGNILQGKRYRIIHDSLL